MGTHAAVATQSPGEIVGGRLYTIKEACRRLGWSVAAFRSARRKGLAVRYMAGRGYIAGQTLIDFVLDNGKDHK